MNLQGEFNVENRFYHIRLSKEGVKVRYKDKGVGCEDWKDLECDIHFDKSEEKRKKNYGFDVGDPIYDDCLKKQCVAKEMLISDGIMRVACVEYTSEKSPGIHWVNPKSLRKLEEQKNG